MKCKYKCDDFTAYSSMEMSGYILSQCSPEDIITTWFDLIDYTPGLYSEDIIDYFSLNDLLTMYRNNILADKIYNAAFDCVDDWLTNEIYRTNEYHLPTLNISININNFHINLIWED